MAFLHFRKRKRQSYRQKQLFMLTKYITLMVVMKSLFGFSNRNEIIEIIEIIGSRLKKLTFLADMSAKGGGQNLCPLRKC